MQFKIKTIHPNGKISIGKETFSSYTEAKNFITGQGDSNCEFSIFTYSSIWESAILDGLFISQELVDRCIERNLR